MSALADQLSALASGLSATIVAHRRALHEIPELSFEERETAQYLERALRNLGLEPRTGLGGTHGLVVELPGAGPGPTVMIRADMDALPIDENSAHLVRSRYPGRMHACGHDGHMAVALGVAEAVTALGRTVTLPGRVVVIFQPAEESGGGAAKLVQAGVLDDLSIDYVLGLHLWSYLQRGQAIIPDGTVMASADEFRITLGGKGGHGALPHLSQDVVVGVAHLISALQTVVSRNVDPLKPAVLTIGHVAAGTAPNVLPEIAMLHGTFRAPDSATRDLMLARIKAIADGVARSLDLELSIEIDGDYPPTVNHPPVARAMREAARTVLGVAGVLEGPPTMAAEDFSVYLQHRPGAFMLLGMRDESRGVIHPHHSPQFLVLEETLAQGAEILLRTAVSVMQHPPKA